MAKLLVEEKDGQGGDTGYITIADAGLRRRLYEITGNGGQLNAKFRYNEMQVVGLRQIVCDWAKEFYRESDLPDFLREVVALEGEAMSAAQKLSKLPFHMLRHALPVGTEIVVPSDDGALQGGVLVGMTVRQGMGAPYLQITYHSLEWTNAGPRARAKALYVEYYSGERDVSRLPFRRVTADEKSALAERANRLTEMNERRALVLHEGVFAYDFDWFGRKAVGLRGRFIVDVAGFCRHDDEMARRLGLSQDRDSGGFPGDEIDDEPEDVAVRSWTLTPYLYGFSFQRKRWGRINIEDTSALKFRDDALDLLVLDKTVKNTIMAVCRAGGHVFKDVVDFKGDGINFILSGPPGTGKTLTAEAVAEALHRPLYIVGSGELGDEPEKVEERLREVVSLAESWGAAVLIDEAEVFMVKRAMGDVTRNAMVSIFLRMLEQHNTVLFLTTNRIDDIDEAFHSRIALSVRYRALDFADRAQVWHNLLSSAGLDSDWAVELSRYELNGREIKHRIRVAQALAADVSRPVSIRDVMDAIRISTQGDE